MKKIFPISLSIFALLSPVINAQTRYVTNTANSGDAALGFGILSAYIGFYLVCFCAIFAIQIAIAVWVYRDAQKRTLDNPVMWLLVTLVGGIIGLIVYLVVRSDKPVIKQPTNPVSVNN